MNVRTLSLLLSATLAVGCSTTYDAKRDFGINWVRYAAEFEALTLQTYAEAERDLAGFIEDTTWSALPFQAVAGGLPPAVILDVDETVVSNVDFQLTFKPPFENWKLDQWNRENPAREIAGVRAFVEAARAKGVTVFFVTNRPCEPEAGEPCPQEQTTLDDIAEVGIETDAEHLLLANEKPAWTREKLVRRQHIAETHRVIMLFGDDLGDFIPCVRTSAVPPCTEKATQQSRAEEVREHADYWGQGWYMLPNPMHGSWTSPARQEMK